MPGVVKAVSQTDGIGLIDVDAFTTLVVRTRNSVYRITILTPHAREVFGPGWHVLPRADRRTLLADLATTEHVLGR